MWRFCRFAVSLIVCFTSPHVLQNWGVLSVDVVTLYIVFVPVWFKKNPDNFLPGIVVLLASDSATIGALYDFARFLTGDIDDGCYLNVVTPTNCTHVMLLQ